MLFEHLTPGWGFFFGIIPGGIFMAVNMVNLSILGRKVRSMAISEGQDWDLNKDFSRRFKVLKDPNVILFPGESQNLSELKKELIKKYPVFMAKHMISGLLMAVGGTIGALIGLYSQEAIQGVASYL
ncbi:hypothetical protein XCY_004125 [Xanthomonas arboricola pv. juglandis]|uniref:hypothetical protein n=1 Tax=Xanthomonas arboricola TaxID=56448 RepID=UPI001AF356BD|nr:hypothetical protein [Xanthomonas arboricola]CAG2098030.1 hypothetical protein XCY_004125 [Xanthomonas arboricola pv. juglandis]